MLLKISKLAGVIIVIGSIVLTMIIGPSINNALGFCLGSFLLLLGMFYSKMPRFIRIITNISIILGITFVLTLSFFIIKDGINDTSTFDEQVVIVLGSGIKGKEITPMLKDRLDKAAEYWHKNPKAVVVVSGGQGYGEDITEAEAMMSYLLTKEVYASMILEEDKARNTYENIQNSMKLIEDTFGRTDYTAVIVTSDFHMFRSLMTAKMYGLKANSYSASLDWYLRGGSFMREIISILKFWYIKYVV